MNLIQVALAVATGAVPLTAGFYTYDRMAGKSSFKRSAYAALAGLGAGVVASLAMVPLLGIQTDYPVMSMNSSQNVSTIGGLPDMWSTGMLPSSGGVPVNVYSKMPSVTDIGQSFGVL
jgi:hypothetical protein